LQHNRVSQEPSISIGLPVFNGEKYIRESVDSLLSQSFADFEVIISDNGSTDKTEEICRSYAKRDHRVRYYREERNRGAAWNFNRVFDLARGKYFKWASDDDVCDSLLLERCVQILDENPEVVLCYPQTKIIDDKGDFVARFQDALLHLRLPNAYSRYKKYHEYFLRDGRCNAVFGLMRTDILGSTMLLGRYVSSDKVLLAELALRGQFHQIQEYLFLSRDHSNCSTKSNKTYEARTAWFDPQIHSWLHLPRWRMLLEHIKSIQRVPITRYEKILCHIQLMRWIGKYSRSLIKDLLRFFIWPFAKPVKQYTPRLWDTLNLIERKPRAWSQMGGD